jgi:hypothetical protein
VYEKYFIALLRDCWAVTRSLLKELRVGHIDFWKRRLCQKFIALMVEAVSTPETSIYFNERYVPEDLSSLCQKLK